MSVITRWIGLNNTGRTTNQCFACCETIRFVDRRYSRFSQIGIKSPCENNTDREDCKYIYKVTKILDISVPLVVVEAEAGNIN